MSAVVSVASGAASQSQCVITPRLWMRDQSKPGALYNHGSGGLGQGNNNADAVWYAYRNFFRDLGDRWPIIAHDNGGATAWGNTASMTAMEAAVSQLRSTYGVSTDPIVITGVSMGGYLSLRYAQLHAADVACVVCIVPAVDLQAIRVNNPTLRTQIDNTWGVTYPTALPSEAVLDTTILSDVPMQLWYASDDNVSENITTFATATGAELHNVGALGHMGGIDGVDFEAVTDFITANT